MIHPNKHTSPIEHVGYMNITFPHHLEVTEPPSVVVPLPVVPSVSRVAPSCDGPAGPGGVAMAIRDPVTFEDSGVPNSSAFRIGK